MICKIRSNLHSSRLGFGALASESRRKNDRRRDPCGCGG